MFLDYEEVIKSAFNDAKKEVKRAKEITDCVPATSRPGFDEKNLRKALEDERDDKLEKWNENFDVFDEKYFEKRVQFLEELDK